MLTRSRVIAGASGLAGEPPDEPLPGGVPMWLRYETAADLETEFLRDLNLSVQNRTMAKVPIQLAADQREFTLSQTGLENPVYVALTRNSAPASATPESIDISNVSLIDGDARDGKRTVAFYADKPQRGILSFTPDGDETITVWYDRTPQTDPSAEQASFTISDSYVPLLKLQLAAQMLELMEKQIGEMLKARIARGMEQWKEFVNTGRQQGVVQKSTYRPGRYGSGTGSQWDAHPGKVNFE